MNKCNHKHGLMLTCRHNLKSTREAPLFFVSRAEKGISALVLSLPKHAHVDWNWPISRENPSLQYLKLEWSVKIPLAFAHYGRCRPSNALAYTESDNAGSFTAFQSELEGKGVGNSFPHF